MLGQQLLRERDDVSRLVPIEADGPDPLLDLRQTQRKHLPGAVGDLEQAARGLIDAGIRGLRRKYHCHEQGVRVHVLELALRLGPCGGETAKNLRDAFRIRRNAALAGLGACRFGRAWAWSGGLRHGGYREARRVARLAET